MRTFSSCAWPTTEKINRELFRPYKLTEKNFSVNFFFCEVYPIFATCYGNSRAQDILHNLLSRL